VFLWYLSYLYKFRRDCGNRMHYTVITLEKWDQYIVLSVQSTPFFIPSSSFCSLSFWFTSSWAHHLITVTTFAGFVITIYHSLGLSLQTWNSSLSRILSFVVSLVPCGLPSQNLALDRVTVFTGHRRLFVLVPFIFRHTQYYITLQHIRQTAQICSQLKLNTLRNLQPVETGECVGDVVGAS